jgi:outer membrane protein OmpA-like peptidoglycan-associated protein
MRRLVVTLILFASVGVLVSACATKGFVREQVGGSETRLTGRVDTQENQLRETTERTTANTQALDAAGQRIQGLDTRVSGIDTRVGEVGALAADAKKEATAVGQAQKDAEAQFTQRWNGRNKYATLETKTVFFDFNKAVLRDEGINDLQEVVKALQADPNAVLELQGFADSRGSDRYNYQLTRERVDAVVRYLVQRHGVDLRRIHAVGMGKAAPAPGERQTRDTLAKSRRVEIRLLAPQS